jgi:CheY-like chemotaxis protein
VLGNQRNSPVEDHGDTAHGLTQLLENRGFPTKTPQNFATALEAVGRENFDLFLCDLDLPDGTGIYFISKARKFGRRQPIALTGHTERRAGRSKIEVLTSKIQCGPPRFEVRPPDSKSRLQDPQSRPQNSESINVNVALQDN